MPRKSKEPAQTDPGQVPASQGSNLSIDLGNAYSNLKASGGIVADIRSIQGRVSDNSRIGDLPFDAVIQLDGVWYAFGEQAPTYTARIEDYPTTDRYTSPWYKRLFAYSLHRAFGLRVFEGPFYPHVIASLPAKEYANDARVQAFKKALTGPYMIGNIQGQTLQVDIMADKLTVIPEGAGAFFSMLKAADQGGASMCATGLWYVLDLGYLTGDIVSFKDGDYMPDSATSDAQIGIRYVADKIARFVRGEGGPDLDPANYDPDLRCDSIIRNGRTYTIKDVKERAFADLGERIGRFLTREASGQNLAGVLLAGGGAEMLYPYIKAPGLPPVLVVPDARRANVEGAFRMLTE